MGVPHLPAASARCPPLGSGHLPDIPLPCLTGPREPQALPTSFQLSPHPGPWCSSPPRLAMKWNAATPVVLPLLATLGRVEVQRAQTWRVPSPPKPPFNSSLKEDPPPFKGFTKISTGSSQGSDKVNQCEKFTKIPESTKKFLAIPDYLHGHLERVRIILSLILKSKL